MTVTDRFYGGAALGAGRTVQDFGLCDLSGGYIYTAKTRAKGMLVVLFFDPASAPSVRALRAIQAWTADTATAKWTAIAVADGDREQLQAFAQAQGITGVSIVLDHELYQTRTWGISNLPSAYLISGKTGRVLQRIIGDNPAEFDAMKGLLTDEIAKIVAAEEAARKAEEEKKAADAAAKAAEAAKIADAAKSPGPAKP